MHKDFELMCNELDKLSGIIENAWGRGETLNNYFGPEYPALTRFDLAKMPNLLAERIRDASIEKIDSAASMTIKNMTKQISELTGTSVNHLFNGEKPQATAAYIWTLDYASKIVEQIIAIQLEKEPNFVLSALTEGRAKVERIVDESIGLSEKVKGYHSEAEQSVTQVINCLKDANRVVADCHEKHRIVTTIGLAAAFDERAKKLDNSMRLWTSGLFVALFAGGLIGWQRFDQLYALVSTNNLQWGTIWMNIILSLLGVGGPIWFAWMATKQIGERFRLAEDYAFKATVAKAYEGYRNEAAKFDAELEARLFGIALGRLEELPLRLIESKAHGSPVHELIYAANSKHESSPTKSKIQNSSVNIEDE